MYDAALLKIGRHFRLSETAKLILGRNEEENGRLEGLSRAGHPFLQPVSFIGPSGLLVGKGYGDVVPISANIMASYAKACELPVTVDVINGSSTRRVIDRLPLAGPRSS